MWTAKDSACIWRASSRYCCETGASAVPINRRGPFVRDAVGEPRAHILTPTRPPTAPAVRPLPRLDTGVHGALVAGQPVPPGPGRALRQRLEGASHERESELRN